MPGQPVIAGNSFTAGMRSELLNTYRKKYDGIREGLSRVMRLGIPSDKNQERFFYWENAPHIKRWRAGENMSDKPFAGVNFTVDNFEYAESISWKFTARQDDQTQSLVTQARQLGESAALLEERLFFQVITAGTDNNLLDAVPNAPDGQALYSTTSDGSTARFGVTNGNLLTGSGVATAGAIRTDLISAFAQFRQMQDTEGQPLWDDGSIDQGVTLYYGAGNEEVFQTAFAQKLVALAASSATSNAGISNIVMDGGYKVRPISTQRISDNDWFIFMEGSDTRAVFSMLRQPLSSVEETWENSDTVRRTGIESIRFWMRLGIGVGVPFQTIKINN